jgi:hypothetical protein
MKKVFKLGSNRTLNLPILRKQNHLKYSIELLYEVNSYYMRLIH